MSKREILLKALAATPQDLARIGRSVDETAVSIRPLPDQWSVADVLSHLYRVEERYLARLQRVVEEERPFLPGIYPDETTHDLTLSFAALLDQFTQARTATLTYLHGLKAGEWQRSAIHSEWGEVKFRTLVQHLVEHDTAHLNQLIEINSKL